MTTAFEALNAVIEARLDALNANLPFTAVQPETAPATHLGHVAWSRGLDYWDSAWSDDQKRQLAKDAPARLRIRGTRAAIEQALAAFQAELTIEEWWEQSPVGTEGTAIATVALGTSLGGSSEDQANVLRLLAREGRFSTHWTLILGVGGSDAIAPAGDARVAVLAQYKGTQVGA